MNNSVLSNDTIQTLMNCSVQDLATYAAKRSVELNPAYSKIKHELVCAAHQGKFELEIPIEKDIATLPMSKEKISINQESFMLFAKEGFVLRVINKHQDGSNMSFSLHNAKAVVISWMPKN